VSGKACFRVGLIVLVALVAGTAAAVKGQARVSAAAQCEPSIDPAYTDEVNQALAQKQDVWGNELLSSPEGPTAEGVGRYLHPLMLVGRPGGSGPRHLTDSGVYYLPFGRPDGPEGASEVELHIADGSQIVSRDVDGPRLTVGVGRAGRERYGSCLVRLQTPRLDGGYLPILETSYTAADGVRYRQESFATVIPETGSLVSFVRVVVNPRLAHRKSGIGYLRLTPSVRGLRQVGDGLRRGDGTRLLFSDGARFNGTSLVYATRPRKALTVYAAWLDQARPTKPLELDRASYEQAKRSMIRYWNRRLSEGATYAVPEKRVHDAERNLLIQNMLMSGRYSLGNAYDGWSFELIDVAEVMGDYGFGKIERAILEKSFRKRSAFPKRAAGERMVGTAHYYRYFGDKAFVDQVTPALGKFVASFENQLNASKVGILDPERYGVDVNMRVYGLHAQAQALQGLRAMSAVWAQTGHAFLAGKADRVATRLEAGIDKAVDASRVALPDGSLFVPIALLDGSEHPYDALTDSRPGSYWNLVMPYALASGVFPPGGPEATGVLDYMLKHGSRFLGLVRFRAYTNRTNPGYRAPGSDDVYGLNVARFLADNDQPDQLDLSLYGKLVAGMTPGTFVSGEGSTIGVVPGQYYRSMFRPPNSANNASFLEQLRLTLVHETRDAAGVPAGLELAYSTPRAWLRPGKQITVRAARTSFGPLSYSLEARSGSVRVSVDVPTRIPKTLKLRLRLPAGERIAGVALEGKAFYHYAPATETIDLSNLGGRLNLIVAIARS